jgi:hypothetical protein
MWSGDKPNAVVRYLNFCFLNSFSFKENKFTEYTFYCFNPLLYWGWPFRPYTSLNAKFSDSTEGKVYLKISYLKKLAI